MRKGPKATYNGVGRPGVVPRGPGTNVVSNVVGLSLGRPVTVGPGETVLVAGIGPTAIAGGSRGRSGSSRRRSRSGGLGRRGRCLGRRSRSGGGLLSTSLARGRGGGRRRSGLVGRGSGGGRAGSGRRRSSDSADGAVGTSSDQGAGSRSLLGAGRLESLAGGQVLVVITSSGSVSRSVLAERVSTDAEE